MKRAFYQFAVFVEMAAMRMPVEVQIVYSMHTQRCDAFECAVQRYNTSRHALRELQAIARVVLLCATRFAIKVPANVWWLMFDCVAPDSKLQLLVERAKLLQPWFAYEALALCQ